MNSIIKTRLLIAVAVLFHIIGFAGIGILHNELIGSATPFHLLLMAGLLLASYSNEIKQFAKWAAIAYLIGFVAEAAGVHTGLVFGHYSYGTVLGPKLSGVPLLIGMNWVVVLIGAIAVASKISDKPLQQSLIAAAVATAYDWVMEPVAVKLGYWQWQDGVIPLYNYLCWFLISLRIALLANKMKITANNFSLWLFLIQLVFFILLRKVL